MRQAACKAQFLSIAVRLLAASAAVCIAACTSAHAPQSNANTAAPTAETADAAAMRGAAYAKQACATCHAVGAGEKKSPNTSAPAFQTVADTPGMTQMALNAWLHTSHPTMPNFLIDPNQIDDLAAYIASLKSTGRT